jgi:hypothetical protein
MEQNMITKSKTPLLKEGDIEIYISLRDQPNSLMQVIKVPMNAIIQIVAHNTLLVDYRVDMPISLDDRAISISQTD